MILTGLNGWTIPKGLAKNCSASDNTIAIRIVQSEFCKELIHQFGKPIVSTSANLTGKATPNNFKEINKSIIEGVDYVVPLNQNNKSSKPSSIIKIETNGSVSVIRK